MINSDKKRLIKSKNINGELKAIGEELEDKPLAVIGTTLVSMAEVIKKKFQIVFKGVVDINRNISKVVTHHPRV